MLRNESYCFPPLSSSLVTHSFHTSLMIITVCSMIVKKAKKPVKVFRSRVSVTQDAAVLSLWLLTHLRCQSVTDKITGGKVTIILPNQEPVLVKKTF